MGVAIDIVGLVFLFGGLFLCTRDAFRKTMPIGIRVSSTVCVVLSIPAAVFMIGTLLAAYAETGRYRTPEITEQE